MTTPTIPLFDDSFSSIQTSHGVIPRVTQSARAVLSPLTGPLLRSTARIGRSLSTRPVLSLGLAYWLTICVVDFLNDWLLAGITQPLRPWINVARDVTIWWTTWLPFTPLIVWLAKRWSYERSQLAINFGRHLVVSLVAVFAHLVIAAATFFFLYSSGPSVSERVAAWLGGFTLTEFLVYWGLVGLAWVFLGERRTIAEGLPKTQTMAGHFAVRENDRIRLVPVFEVDWLEADGNYIRLHVGDNQHVVRGSLRSALERLDPDRFLRIHRSTVVNVLRVREIQPWFSGDYIVTLQNGHQLKVSRTYRDALLAPMI